jgi:antitoxin HicB
MKDLTYYFGLPYTIVLRRDEEDDTIARVDELPGCTAHGSTPQEALEVLQEVMTAWIEDAIEAGHPIPEPSVEDALPSGKWVQRVPRSLHAKATEAARREGVSLNQFVSSILAEAIGKRSLKTEVTVEELKISAHNLYSISEHNNWLSDANEPMGSIDVISSADFAFSDRVRLFAKRIPGKFSGDLKALQNAAKNQERKLPDA